MSGTTPPHGEASRRGPGPGLATRLLTAQVLVVLVGVLTAWLVAAAAGPPLFHQHLGRAGVPAATSAATHAEEAFRSANLLALTLALLAALAAALAASVYVTRRIGRSVGDLAEAASAIAAGRYDTTVPASGLGAEFDSVAAAFNAMADRLGSVESTRRRLLADLAHEMRTPVSTLETYLDALEDGVTTYDAESAEVMRAQTRRLTRLAEDVGAVSRAEEGRLHLDPEPVPAAELVQAATSAAGDRYASKGVQLVTAVEDENLLVTADRDRLGQVLGNLLDNALRHTPAEGKVEVVVRRSGDHAVLTVSDTGEGVAPEHLPHLFERFYRADAARDRDRGGSGIGLAIVKALVEAHGGTVAADSDGPGRGATFTLTLPARPAEG